MLSSLGRFPLALSVSKGSSRAVCKLFREAGARASEELEPDADIHASTEYRREIAAVLTRRALATATAGPAANAA